MVGEHISLINIKIELFYSAVCLLHLGRSGHAPPKQYLRMPCWGADRWTFCIYQLPPVVSLLLDVTFFRCLFYECQRPHGYFAKSGIVKTKSWPESLF